MATDLKLPLPLDELRLILRRYGVTEASVFGSYARNEQKPGSDLDLLVKLANGRDYLDLGGLQYELQKKTGIQVDIATKINKHFAKHVAQDLVEIL